MARGGRIRRDGRRRIGDLSAVRCRGRGQSEQSRRAPRHLRPVRLVVELAGAKDCAARGGMLIVDEGLHRPRYAVEHSAGADSFRPRAYDRAALIWQDLRTRRRAARIRHRLGRSRRTVTRRPRRLAGERAGDRDRQRHALADDSPWLEQTRLRLERDAGRLDRLLAGSGFEAPGGTPLFRLARHENAGAVFANLLRHGILARPFAELSDRLRFGIPADETAWGRLSAALQII